MLQPKAIKFSSFWHLLHSIPPCLQNCVKNPPPLQTIPTTDFKFANNYVYSYLDLVKIGVLMHPCQWDTELQKWPLLLLSFFKWKFEGGFTKKSGPPSERFFVRVFTVAAFWFVITCLPLKFNTNQLIYFNKRGKKTGEQMRHPTFVQCDRFVSFRLVQCCQFSLQLETRWVLLHCHF